MASYATVAQEAESAKDDAVDAKTAAEAAQVAAEAAAEQAEGAIEVDDTLSVKGRAADAKETGDKIKKIADGTLLAVSEDPTYLAHRYLNPNTGLPTTTTSNAWNLYKIDVSDCDAVQIKTYRTSTGSSSFPLYSFVDSDFENVTITSETADNVVGFGDLVAPTDQMYETTVSIPESAKTMFVPCASAYSGYPQITIHRYGHFQDLKNVPATVKDVQVLKETINGYVNYKNSPYYKPVRWGVETLNSYYHSDDDGTSLFTSTITASQYFELFNALVADYPYYAESHEMGIASDDVTMMYYYTLNPLTNQDSAMYKRPKFIISAGQHGFEKTANFGVFWFVKNLLENWEDNESLAYMRNHVQFVIMPMLNPYGFNNDTYGNANGVNLNRNWGTTAWSKGTQGTSTYGGEEPFSEPETQYARDVVLNNLDAIWLTDYHNNGQIAPSSQSGYLWHSFALVTYDDPYFTKAIDAAKWNIDEITGHLYANYPDQCQYVNSGTFTDNNAPSHQGLIVAYAREQGVMAATMEGGAAFIGSGNRYSSAIHHMNADLIGNWTRCLISTYAKIDV